MLRLLNEAEEKEIEVISNPDSEVDVEEKEEMKIENDSNSVEVDKIDSEEIKKQEKIVEEGQKEGCKEAINVLTKNFWDLIAHVESVIATFKFDFKNKDKDNIIEILNGVIDDLTINLGMLSKVFSLIDEEEAIKNVELMSKGEQKADKIIKEK